MEELKRRAAALDERVGRLDGDLVKNTEAMDRLTVAQQQLADRMDRSDRDRRWFTAAILAVVVIVVGVGLVAVRAERTAREQEQLRNEVLCPLYGLILGGYDPTTRPEGDARQKYEDTFVIIRQGYGVLRCTSPLVPPRSDLPR